MKKKSPHIPTSRKKPSSPAKLFAITFEEAKKGISHKHGGPFGAIILLNNKIISKAHNTVLRDNDPTCHAEVNAIRAACAKMRKPHLKNAILIASSEPCPMCLTTSYWAQISKIYYALPRKIAADYGFIDDFIYIDIKKPKNKRKLKVIGFPEYFALAEKTFKTWQSLKGKVY